MTHSFHLSNLALACLLTSFSAVSAEIIPSDPLFKKSVNNVDYQWGLHALNLPRAWDYVRGNAYVAVLDMGINTTHPDLQANFRPQLSYDFFNDSDDVDEFAAYTRQGGRRADLVGHGTHVAGILAATTNNSIGGAGVCWYCSLMIGKISELTDHDTGLSVPKFNLDAAEVALRAAVDSGAQVVNMSFGVINGDCAVFPDICQAIQHAVDMDVVVVAAVGNYSHSNPYTDNYIQFPASNSGVIAAYAVDSDFDPSAFMPQNTSHLELGAPGRDILSTFQPNIDWIPRVAGDDMPDFAVRKMVCADSRSAPPGYGPCSGSSMASPLIAGLAALVRSANPLLRQMDVRTILRDNASEVTSDSVTKAPKYGVPDAEEAVKAAMGVANGEVLVNRLTPLFSLYSNQAKDHFYTTVPQMAMAALYETMYPQPPSGNVTWISTRGDGASASVPGYSNFPRYTWAWADDMPMAQVYVFTTDHTPPNYTSPLVPLYRLSRQRDTGTNPLNLDHTYTTSQAEVDYYESQSMGYNLDGIEGYVFQNEVGGTVKLCRRYNPTLDDHAVFPETILSWMEGRGYTVQDGFQELGYVYLNRDSDHDGLIDGFEEIIGTSSSNTDSDGDGISDGVEVNRYPYSDPLG